MKNTHHLHGKKILIVEDDALNSSLLEEILSEEKPTLYFTPNGSDAVLMALEKKPDLILMDIGLPDMSGYESVREILLHLPKARIIALTAFSSQTDREKALAVGCIEHVGKPINSQQLLSLINKYL